MNVVMIKDSCIEVQGIVKGEPFSLEELLALLALSRGSIDTIAEA
ncbi:MAG: hypothetical protein ACR5K7_02595 [Symbiopectobacterium sp.]